jgi:hypothetical protein
VRRAVPATLDDGDAISVIVVIVRHKRFFFFTTSN